MSDFAPPNPYTPGLAVLMSEEQKTLAALKAAAFTTIDEAAAATEAENTTALRALRTNDLSAYRAPDGYAEGIRALQQARR